MNTETNFDFGDSEFDSQNYKSCFARSVAVNSDYRMKKLTAKLDFKNVQSKQGVQNGAIPKTDSQGQVFVKMRKVSSIYFYNLPYSS